MILMTIGWGRNTLELLTSLQAIGHVPAKGTVYSTYLLTAIGTVYSTYLTIGQVPVIGTVGGNRNLELFVMNLQKKPQALVWHMKNFHWKNAQFQNASL